MRYSLGLHSSMHSTEDTDRAVISWKILSMQRAGMWTQSMIQSAYAFGFHIQSTEPRDPTFNMNPYEPDTESTSVMSRITPSRCAQAGARLRACATARAATLRQAP